MNLEDAIKEVKKKLPKFLKEYIQESREDMLTNIELEFDKPSASALYRTSSKKSLKPNTGKTLRLVTGALVDSYNPKDKNSASSVKITNGTVEQIYKSKLPYATVHEFGGGNNIPKRPYLKPAEIEYEKQEKERLDRLLKKIERIFN